jgi:enoyl-CoA hydratase/carnithine racemase
MTDLIKTEIRGPILEIVLNRPEKRNAINNELYQAFDAAVNEANKLSDLRAVLIRGEGKVFSAGIDYSDFLRLPEAYGPDWQRRMRKITDDFQRVLTNLERLELPTIALLHGYCLGLAMELALACDIRIAADGTKLGLPETLLGMIPDVGGTTRLVRLIGPGKAKELIFTGRQIDAGQAENWGIVNHVVPQEELLAAGENLAEEINQAAPLAVGMAKRVIDGLADIDRGLMLEGWAQSQLFATEDFMEGVQAKMMQRKPHFKGR